MSILTINDSRLRSYLIYQANVPMILPSSGSIGNNGALTGLTALPTTFASCYMYFPANAIEAGSTAGWHYVVMSSTTAGTIYNNTFDAGVGSVPAIPVSPTAFATTGPGAYTQTTASDITMLSFNLPGGALGINGSMITYQDMIIPSNANAKTVKQKIGGTATNNLAFTAATQSAAPMCFRNNGSQSVNSSNNSAGFQGSITANALYTTIDTSTDQTVIITANLAAATDYIIELGVMAQVNPS